MSDQPKEHKAISILAANKLKSLAGEKAAKALDQEALKAMGGMVINA
jgi:hypothetical protein